MGQFYTNAFKLKMWYINYYTDSFYTLLYMDFLLVNLVNQAKCFHVYSKYNFVKINDGMDKRNFSDPSASI